jgi:endonuclease I
MISSASMEHGTHTERRHAPPSSRTTARVLLLALLAACSGDPAPIGFVAPPPSSTCRTTPPSVAGSYYATTRDRCGAELLSALHQIVRGQRLLGYTAARDSLYAFVDRGDRPAIVDIYAGRVLVGVTTRASAAANGVNTEHLWPRSRGAELDPALSDLHHLRTSIEVANAQRSNLPFGLVRGAVLWTSPNPGTPTEVSRMGYANGSSGPLVFEPRPSVRGDIARALLYFHLRYHFDRPAGYSTSNFAQERDLLIQWAKDDPPDSAERARNDAVQRAQGNRNPYIDWPALLDLVGTLPLQ